MNDFEYVLVDGSAFLFRSYYANMRQNLTSPDGFPTGAMFGVISSIKKLEKSYPSAKLILIFDAKGKNFRHQMYPEYKANRKDADPELIMQIQPLYDIISNMGVHFFCVDGVEADDTIATLASQNNKAGIKTLIASGDKDLMQLVGGHVYQLDMKGDLLDYDGVIKKSGVRPEQIRDLLALTGDSADNIPGVPSVGPKTAVKWLTEHQDIATIKAHADQVGGKVGEKLRENFELLDLSYQLVTLKTDVALPECITSEPPLADTERLYQLYTKYGFNTWLKEVAPTNTVDAHTDNTLEISTPTFMEQYRKTVVFSPDDFTHLVNLLSNSKYFIFDLETTGLDYINDQIVGIVFLVEKSSFYIPIGHSYLGVPDQLDGLMVLDTLRPILEDSTIGKIGQNLKYDSHILMNHNIYLQGIIHDTMLLSYCLNSTATRHNMDDLATYYLGYTTTHFKDIAGTGKKQLSFDRIDISIASDYALEDVIVTNELFLTLSEQILKTPSLYKLYMKVELPLIAVMVAIERSGVRLDTGALHTQFTAVDETIRSLTAQIYEMAGVEFNLDSPKQLKEVLFGEHGLGLESKKKTTGGELSTNEEALKTLDHPIAKLLLEYRMLNKLSTTYLQALPKNINPTTGRLHTSYHQSGTATGRLSSSNPNLQNIPIRTEQGAKIRQAFIAKDGYSIVALDYSQIELRLIAHLSEDKNLISAFNSGEDIHKSTASLMFDTPITEVDSSMRRSAKAINFGLMYGMGAHKLAKQIGVSNTVASDYIKNYFNSYPGVKKYITSIKATAKSEGFVETIMGRRLYLPDINSKSRVAQAHAERIAVNAPMQGSSADIIKCAMHEIYQQKINATMLMQVHDELVFEVESSQVSKVGTQLKQIMEHVVTLKVPLIVDIGVGANWAQAH